MLLYNSAAGAVLANAGAGVRLVGVLIGAQRTRAAKPLMIAAPTIAWLRLALHAAQRPVNHMQPGAWRLLFSLRHEDPLAVRGKCP